MTMLQRTDLTTPSKVHLAAAAVAGQGSYGAISELAREFSVSRPTVYDVQKRTQAMLSSKMQAKENTEPVSVVVDRRQLDRAIVALRVVAPNSIRAIEDLLPILYPGMSPSYGTIQSTAADAECRASEWNLNLDLSPIKAAAVDEMFSQGDPVLAGVDLDSGTLFALALRESRGEDDWAEVLDGSRDQGLSLDVVVKDAALGIKSGVKKIFPRAEQRDDCFHALYNLNKVHRYLESKAYRAIARADDAKKKLNKVKRTQVNDEAFSFFVNTVYLTELKCLEEVALFDRFEDAQRDIKESLEFVDLETSKIRDAVCMREALEKSAERIIALEDKKCRKVGRYIKNRAPGLSLYADDIKYKLNALSLRYGDPVVRLCSVVWRLMTSLKGERRLFEKREGQKLLAASFILFEKLAGTESSDVLSAVDAILQRRHRASSAIEGFNAALRPFLYVHKGVTQGFLNLFQAHYNLRRRRWGKHKGTSAYGALTGETNHDWLEILGYPRSLALN